MQTVCRACHFGRIQATLAPFMASYAGKMMLVPNAPAYTCDYCGATKHDEAYLKSIQLLLREQAMVAPQAGKQVAPPQPTLATSTIEEYPLG